MFYWGHGEERKEGKKERRKGGRERGREGRKEGGRSIKNNISRLGIKQNSDLQDIFLFVLKELLMLLSVCPQVWIAREASWVAFGVGCLDCSCPSFVLHTHS